MLGLQYIDQGFRSLISLGVAMLFKDYYKLEPSESQYWTSFIVFPWSIKLVYGILSDNLVIAGSRKKSYIVIGGSIQFLALQVIFWFEIESVGFVSVLFMLVALSSAFMDVIADSMMVIQARKDPERGAEKLQAYSWTTRGFGGITGSLLSAFLLEYFHPRWCVLVYSLLGLCIMYSGLKLNPEIDAEGLEEMNGFCKDVKRSLREIWEIRRIPEIYRVLGYLVLRGLAVPSFSSFWYYYTTKIKGFSQFVIGLMGVIGNISLFLGAILYNKYFQKWEFRRILAASNFIVLFGGLLGVIFINNGHRYFGIPDVLFYSIQSFFEDALLLSFVDLPSMVLFAKITPKHIEGTIFALLTGTINFANTVLAPALGGLINDSFVGVTTANLSDSNFLTLIWIETVMALVPLTFMNLIPLRS